MVTEQIKITNPMGSTTQSVDINTTSPTGNKPLAITSVEAQNAVHMVTPERISTLLENRGPLAIRFITQNLSEDIPYFKNLSTSKQRRLIMNVMETGYESKSLIFEKIGWGLWTIKQVSPQTFKQERDITNKLNAKVRDNSNNPNLTDTKRRLSNSNNIRKKSQIDNNNNNSTISSNVPLSPKLKAQQNSHHILSNNGNNIPRSVVYIDENVLQTDEEDNNVFSEEDEEEEDANIGSRFGLSNNSNVGRSKSNNLNNNNGTNKIKNEHEDFVHSMIKPNGSFSFNRRKSSVVYDNDTNGTIEQEMLAQKIRPIIKNRSRRSSSKGRPIHILGSNNNSNTNSTNINGNSIIGSPLSGTRILDNEIIPPLPKILYSDNDNGTNIVGPVIPLRKGSISGPLNTSAATNGDIKQNNNNNRGSFSESVSRRSSSRVSVSKESGIRSTLLHTLNDSHVNSNNNNNSGTTSNNIVYSQFGTFQNSSVPIIEQKDQILATATTNPSNNIANNNNNNRNMVMNSPHSDTDEEDWANIGAESLRTMSNDISPVQTNNKLANNNNPQQQLNNPDDADDAARVLLSLK